MICVSLQNKEFSEIQELLPSLEMAEIRLDRCALTDEDRELLFSQSDVPLIEEESGAPEILERAIKAGAKYVDLEMEAPAAIGRRIRQACQQWGTVLIRSYHNFDTTPPLPVLESIARRAESFGAEIVKIAVKSMSLDDLKPFNPSEKVIEYLIEDKKSGLAQMSVEGFTRETASESPAPGGGSVSAAMGAFGAALATMVANLSSHKRGWDERWKEFSDVAVEGQKLLDELLGLIDEDTAAFNRIMDCFSMPKGTEEEKAARAQAIEDATLYAAEVPLRTMEAALKALPLALQMAQKGNPASASDAGVAALAAAAGIRGARLNVRINAAGLKDKSRGLPLLERADAIEAEALRLEEEVLSAVNAQIAV